MRFSSKKMKSLFKSWLILEAFKFVGLFMILVFPEFSRTMVYYSLFILFFVTVYSYAKTFPYFKFCLGRSIFEEYEQRRLEFVHNRNYLFLLMILDIFPILLFPQPILRFVYWNKNKKLAQDV